ncbi:hypothetical protein [Oceanobacillus jeddahense]|uniref:DUF3953 domain-containing protein n=1 Tax=Oceanobacillus jeddahense TaxID=1462527 RepID=A0ABY5K0W5_9BACI|nr:hypothetical protein [Oceanobacillus jeddahense]UUI04419.1 hypothetical protein NP439_07125 [Oceanobacillus jeddahense]
MEQKMESSIDNALDAIAPQLFLFSIIIGTILILIGIVFMVKKSSTRKLHTAGIICVGIGMIAIVSGLIQI